MNTEFNNFALTDFKRRQCSYIYDSPEDHFQKLMDILAFAKDEYENNFEKFEERIDMLYEEMMENNTPLALSPKIKELLQI